MREKLFTLPTPRPARATPMPRLSTPYRTMPRWGVLFPNQLAPVGRDKAVSECLGNHAPMPVIGL
jgi:hypothetical protein